MNLNRAVHNQTDSIRYRSEIDGLRGIAIISVILFHLDASLIDHGYLGVDVFFVISGFLITQIIWREKMSGKFSLSNFYKRRILRIFPALFAMLISVLALSPIFLGPLEYEFLAKMVASAVTFCSNFFLLKQGDYFGSATQNNLLLHTWSLAVEEQFYIVFPIVIGLFWKLGETRLKITILFLGLFSLLLSIIVSRYSSVANFYIPVTRFWELLFGGISGLIFLGMNPVERFKSKFLSSMGLLLIILSISASGIEEKHSVLLIFAAVIGTCLCLIFCRKNEGVGRILSSPALRNTGLISYSLYLWHQPIIVLSGEYYAFGYLSDNKIFIVALLFVISLVSWRYIENPFRAKKTFKEDGIFRLSFLFFSFISLFATLVIQNSGFPGRVAGEHKDLILWKKFDPSGIYRTRDCMLAYDQTHDDFDESCYAREMEQVPDILIWGDSHAASLYHGMKVEYPRLSISQLTMGSCPPILDYPSHHQPYCEEINEHVLDFILTHRPSRVIMLARWASYQTGKSSFSKKLNSTLSRLSSAGVDVFLFGNLPQWKPSLPDILANSVQREARSFIGTRELERLSVADEVLSVLAKEQGLEFVSIIELVCKESACLGMVPVNGNDSSGLAPIAYDYAHLTPHGSIAISNLISIKLGF